MNAPYAYVGDELHLFARAARWKRYIRDTLAPYLKGSVLEVGAGIGATTTALYDASRISTWTCLEPDPALASQLTHATRHLPAIETRIGTLDDLTPLRRFDCILYIDVLEHIQRDRDELERSIAHLRPGGAVVVLAPAHQSLFSPFDRALGHFRRYDRSMLRQITPDGAVCERLFYLDSVGVLCSLANRVLLRRQNPTPAQIDFWDSVVIPASRWLDRLTANRLGKSIVAVYRRSDADAPAHAQPLRQAA
jgi:SAM-dependent methyltransferase